MASPPPPPPNNLTLEPVISKLEKFILYETQSYLYIVGCDKRQTEYRVIKLDRQVEQPSSLSEILLEDDCIYSRAELKDMLEMIHEGNKTQGGLQRINTGFGILGFVRFLDCYYLILVTQRRKVGSMSGNTIYGVKATEMVPIKPMKDGGANQSWGKQVVGAVNKRLNPTQHEIAEQRYLGLFQFIDLTKDFYFSYTYDLSHSLQHNISSATSRVFPPPPCKDMYAWNYYLTSEIEGCLGKVNSCYWVLPIIHGSFTQRRCSLFGRIVDITLIARRSRHFAGTRYLKRGVSDCGKVANDVEMEQVVHAHGVGEGLFSSFLQVRGSIPTFWTQETSVTMPKPPIVLNRIDPTYAASQLHFADLMERYASPVLVLDLTKHHEKREREMIVSGEYRTAIECLNSYMDEGQPKIQYCALDFSELSKQRNMNVLSSLKEVAAWATQQTGFYCSSAINKVDIETGTVVPLSEATELLSDESKTRKLGRGFTALNQQGVLRTNCIDCLDRTNVAQFCVGVHALGLQLTTMGVITSPVLENDSAVVVLLMDIYSAVGDQIALQYGGSEAHKKVASGAGVAANTGASAGTSGGGKEFLTSIRRYYSNAFTDRLKQDAMNVFLGHYVVSEHEVALWDLDNDYYLHNFKVQNGVELTMTKYRQSWEAEADELEKLEEMADEEYEEEQDAAHSREGGDEGGDDKGLSSEESSKRKEQVEAVKSRVMKEAINEAEAEAIVEKTRSKVAQVAAQSPIGQQVVNSPVPILKTEGKRSRRGDLRHSLPNMNGMVQANNSSDAIGGKNDEEEDVDDLEGGRDEEYGYEDEDREEEENKRRLLEEKLRWKEGARLRAQQKQKEIQQERVARRCQLQRESSQQWWKEALLKHERSSQPLNTSNFKQPKTIERFERIHRPEKLTQFDKKFNYDFNVPIPLQANQETVSRNRGFAGMSGANKKPVNNPSQDVPVKSSEEVPSTRFLKDTQNGSFTEPSSTENTEKAGRSLAPSSVSSPYMIEEGEEGEEGVGDDEEGPDRVITIGRLVRDLFPLPRGNRPNAGHNSGGSFTTNNSHVKERPSPQARSSSVGELTVVPDAAGRYGVAMTSSFVGNDAVTCLSADQREDLEHFKEFSEFAVAPENYFKGSLHKDAKSEMEVANWEVELASTDVAGCRACTDLAHTSKTIKIGPYRGLDRNESANQIASVVHHELIGLTTWCGSHVQTQARKAKAEEAAGIAELSALLSKTTLTVAETNRLQFLTKKYGKSIPLNSAPPLPPPDEAFNEMNMEDEEREAVVSRDSEDIESDALVKPPPKAQRRGSAGPAALAAAAAAAIGISKEDTEKAPSTAERPPPPPAPVRQHEKFVEVDLIKEAQQSLAKQNYDTSAGIASQIAHGLSNLWESAHIYESMLDGERLSTVRSPLSDNETMDLYSSFFQDDALCSDQSLDFLVRVTIPQTTNSRTDNFAVHFPTTVQETDSVPLLPPELEAALKTGSDDSLLDDPMDLTTSMSAHVSYSVAVRKLESIEAQMRASEVAQVRATMAAAAAEKEEPDSPGANVPYVPLNPPLPPPRHVLQAQQEEKARKMALLSLLQEESNATASAHAQLLELQQPSSRNLSAPTASSLLSNPLRSKSGRRASSFIPKTSSIISPLKTKTKETSSSTSSTSSMKSFNEMDATTSSFINQQKMIDALGGHFQDPVSEKRFAEQNVGPVFGMSQNSTDGKGKVLNPNMPEPSKLSGGRRRKGSLAPVPVEVQEKAAAANAASAAASSQSSKTVRMYYGYNPKETGDTVVSSTRSSSKQNHSSNSAINSTRTRDLRTDSTQTAASLTSQKSHLNQAQTGFFVKEDNPYVLFNHAGARSSAV